MMSIYTYICSQERANEEGIKMPTILSQAKPQKREEEEEKKTKSDVFIQ